MGIAPRCLVAAAALLAAALCQAAPPAWRVSDDTGRELWLLGSVHYLSQDDYPLPPVVDELYARSEVLVMELDLDDLDPAAAQSTLAEAALLPDGETLQTRLDPGVYRRTRAAAATLGVGLAQLELFEPWLVAVTLLDLGMAAHGFAPESGVEQYLLGKAAGDGKEIVGLESIEAQVAVFDELPRGEQQALLEQTLDELESAESAMGELIDAWRDGELEQLAASLFGDFEGFPGLYETLVAERNRAWVAPLEAYLERPEPHLVVVGALHLVGPDSVLELLRARGLRVERVD